MPQQTLTGPPGLGRTEIRSHMEIITHARMQQKQQRRAASAAVAVVIFPPDAAVVETAASLAFIFLVLDFL